MTQHIIEKNNQIWILNHYFKLWHITYVDTKKEVRKYILSDDPKYRDQQLKHSIMFQDAYKEISDYILEKGLLEISEIVIDASEFPIL